MDAAGKVIASGSEEHEAFASPRLGWAEQDPRDWWRACGSAVRKALHSSHLRADDIACVGFSGQMHGAVLLDSKDEVVRSAIIWCDQRSEAQSRELEELFGRAALIQLTCNPPLTNFTLTKLLWVRENEPENWARVAHVMLPKDYVRFRLTGERAIDMADASGTLLLDVAHRRWSTEVLSKAGIDIGLLPALHESPQICGKVSATGAEATGLRVGTPVVAGAGDQAAGAVGMGIARAGAVSATIGTSGVVFAATDRPALDPQGRLHTFCHAIPGRWHVMGVTQAAGLSLRWIRDRFGIVSGAQVNQERDPYDILAEEASTAPAGSDGAFWAPYLMGERTPHLDPNARAALVGLTASHTRGHIIRAVMEGVAYSLKDTFTIFDEMQYPRHLNSPGWRRREIASVAADSGRRLRARSGNCRSRGRRSLRRGDLSGSRGRSVEFRRRSLRQGRPRGHAHRAASVRFKNHAAGLPRLPQDLSGAASGIRLNERYGDFAIVSENPHT